jgi:hypothetical protein
MDLIRIKIGDILASLLGDGNKVTHVVIRDGEIILLIRIGGLTDKETIVTEPDDLTHIL